MAEESQEKGGLKGEMEKVVLMVAAEVNEKPLLSVILSDSLTDKLNAGELVRTMATHIKGGGGGQPFYATAGGKELGGLKEALEAGINVVKEKL